MYVLTEVTVAVEVSVPKLVTVRVSVVGTSTVEVMMVVMIDVAVPPGSVEMEYTVE